MVKGALTGLTNGFAGSSTAQMMNPRKASTMNSWKKRKPWLVWVGLGKLQRMLAAPPLKLSRGVSMASMEFMMVTGLTQLYRVQQGRLLLRPGSQANSNPSTLSQR